MSEEKPKRIHLLGEGHYEEAPAGAILQPGQLVKLNASGALVTHNVAGGPAEKAFVLEDALQGRTIETLQAVDEQTPFVVAGVGDVVYAFLEPGESVTPADYLTSAGTGALMAATGTNAIIGVPLETVDNSDSSNSTAIRIRVRIV